MNGPAVRRALSALTLSLAALAAPGGCGRSLPPAPAAPAEENAVVQVRERGPVKVTLRVEPKEPTFADRVRFTIQAIARKGVEVTLPSPGENLGAFAIKDFDAPPEVATAESTEYRRSYVLEVLTSGEYKIPPMTISFRDLRPPADGGPGDLPEKAEAPPEKHGDTPPAPVSEPPAASLQPPAGSDPPAATYQIVTDEIALNVKPLADPASLKELAPLEAQAEPPPLPPQYAWPLGIAGGLAGAGLVTLVALRLFRRKSLPPPPIPPHERAYRELEWLLGQALLDRGELKEFFFQLSRILREYVENRFGLRAPERTTEEFLAELSTGTGNSGKIPRDHQRLLREFLERADLVKFARYAPTRDEIEASFESAKRFIEESRAPDRAAHPAEPGSDGRPEDGAPVGSARTVKA